MNLEEIRNSIRDHTAISQNDSLLDDAVLTRFANEGLNAYQSEFDWPWLEETTTLATVQGTESYAAPTDWVRTVSVHQDGFETMVWLPMKQMDEHATTTQGRPIFYSIYGEEIFLRPVPSTALTLIHRYIKEEPELSASTDTPLLPRMWRPLIVEYATHLAHLRNKDEGRAQAALQRYQGWLTRMRDNRRRVTAPLRVRVRSGSEFPS